MKKLCERMGMGPVGSAIGLGVVVGLFVVLTLRLLRVLEAREAILLAAPLAGVVWLLQAYRERNRSRSTALLMLCAGLLFLGLPLAAYLVTSGI